MPDPDQASYMRRHGFTRRLQFITSTPAEFFGHCHTPSIEINVIDGNLEPTIDTYKGRPHADPNRCENLMVTYFLTKVDFERHSWLRLAGRITAWMSVAAGKQFIRPKFINVNGNWLQYSNGEPEKIWNRELPFYSDRPRVDEGEKLDFESFGILENIIYSTDPCAKTLHAAAEFYASALRRWLTDPERAYLDLVTAGECLIAIHEYKWSDLADAESKEIVKTLRDAGKERLAKMYQGKSTFIAERYVRTLLAHLPMSVYTLPEYAQNSNLRFTSETIKSALKKSYHLRSAFVHDGGEFGAFTSIIASRSQAEVWGDFSDIVNEFGQSEADGASKIISHDLQKQIGKAATFVGLERITRLAIILACKNNWSKVVSGCDGRMTGPLPDNQMVLGHWSKVNPKDIRSR